MQLGMIGLGRMGASMVRRLLRNGHACVVHDVQPSAVTGLVKDGAAGAASLKEMVSQPGQPRTIWLMVPAAGVDQALGDRVPLFDAGDIVIDGGNSYYRDDMRRGTRLQTRGIHHLDVGTSGGVAGLERGYCLMIGGEGGVVRATARLKAFRPTSSRSSTVCRSTSPCCFRAITTRQRRKPLCAVSSDASKRGSIQRSNRSLRASSAAGDVVVKEDVQKHCQAGKYGLAFQVITAWLDSQPAMAQQV